MTRRSKVGLGRGSRAGLLATTALAGMAAMLLPAGAEGQTRPPGNASRLAPAEAATHAFNIPPQPLADALAAFGRQSGLQVTVDARIIAGLASPGVAGPLPAAEALRRLLAGSGLVWRIVDGRTVVVARPGSSSRNTGTTTLPPVTVQGSRDPARTEGTQSYTSPVTTIGRLPLPLREIPQSVSVITHRRIQDQNMTSLDDAMLNAPGITLGNANAGYNYDSRGFPMTTITIDGVLESLNGALNGSLDLAPYDRVEILRGPAGLFNGPGNPGGTVNLARKRALDTFQFTTSATIGSWSRYNGDLDVTGPLNAAKTLRGRFVAAGLDRDSFVDTWHDRKGLLYGTLEFDLTPETTLSVGGIYQRQRTTCCSLPAGYPDGRLLDVPRSTFTGADWNYFKTERKTAFADIEHRFDNGGIAKISFRYSDRNTIGKYAFGTSTTAPIGSIGTSLNQRPAEDLSVDGYISSPFQFLGQQQNILVGANYNRFTQDVLNWTGPIVGQQNFFNPIHSFPEPDDSRFRLLQNTTTTQNNYGMYGQARLKPLSWATFVLGGRLSSFDTKTFNHLTGVTSSKYAVINTFTPYAGLVLNLSDTISAYGSYTSIFSPQSAVTYDGKLLPPVEGNQYEGGLTGTFFNKTLNARIAYFYTIRENTSLADPDHPGFSIAGGSARSRGFEAEMSGRVLPGWQIAASYAFTETLNLKAAVSQQGLPITTIKPRHLFKLWTKYTFQDGVLKDFSLGGGLRAQSSWYVQRGVRWRQPGLAIVDLQLGYRFSAHLDATLTVTNLLDKTYFQSMGTGGSGTYYGEPRNVMFTMRAKF